MPPGKPGGQANHKENHHEFTKLRKRLLPLALGRMRRPGGPRGRSGVRAVPGRHNGDAIPDVADPRRRVQAPRAPATASHHGRRQGAVHVRLFRPDRVLPAAAVNTGLLAANFSAPTIELKEGQRFYLTLTNVGMVMRPDLFDPHTVHFHGFPNQAPVFDGVPEGSFGVNMGSSVTYYYNITEPGTYIYHCHMEATEHMQMGMLGKLYVRPAQDGTLQDLRRQDLHPASSTTTATAPPATTAPTRSSSARSTTTSTTPPGDPAAAVRQHEGHLRHAQRPRLSRHRQPRSAADADGRRRERQQRQPVAKVSALITATAGEKILLRLSNLSVTNYYTVTTLGLPMRVVGGGAHIARGPGGKNLYYDTSSVTLGGGETSDVIVDTAGVAPAPISSTPPISIT